MAGQLTPSQAIYLSLYKTSLEFGPFFLRIMEYKGWEDLGVPQFSLGNSDPFLEVKLNIWSQLLYACLPVMEYLRLCASGSAEAVSKEQLDV